MSTREAHEQRPGRARTTRKRHAKRPRSLETELALATDGGLYVNAAGVQEERMQDRARFQGYALTEEEVERLGPRGVLLLALGDCAAEYGGRVAIASDGLVYVERVPGPQARVFFRGFAMTEQERELAVEEIHRMAFNVTAGVQLTLRERRKRKPRERRTA
jgi:hypothetical protein